MLNNEQLIRLDKAQTICISHVNDQKILGVKKLLILEMCKFMCKYSNGLLPKSLMNGFEKSKHNYPTRNCNVPVVPKHRSTIYNNSYMVKCTNEWLKIPHCYKTKPKLKTLVKHLKVRLIRRLL